MNQYAYIGERGLLAPGFTNDLVYETLIMFNTDDWEEEMLTPRHSECLNWLEITDSHIYFHKLIDH